MKFRYTILYVENVEQTLSFYERAFGFARLMVHESGDYAELDTGDTKLAFLSLSAMEDMGKTVRRVNSKQPSFEIAFETQDVEGSFDRAVQAGAKSVQAPENMPWGQIISYVEDLNGFLVEICSPL